MKKKIAIVGSGISGLTAGFLLHKLHDITLFEAAPTLGGHTATVDVHQAGRSYAIDTGFIVFNDRTYPNFLRLLERIGVARQPAEMSFSVKSSQGLEYNGHNLDTLFSQRSNLLSPVSTASSPRSCASTARRGLGWPMVNIRARAPS